MNVQQLVPRVEAVDVVALLRELRQLPRAHAGPFDPARIELSEAVSRAIFRHPRSRAFPETIAVAFWLRRAAVSRLADRFAALVSAGPARAPRGLAFHLPPTNVDTLFLYSLMVSFLVGNLNIVRVSRDRPSEQVMLLAEVLRNVLSDERFGAFAAELAVLSYGHEPEPTALVSQDADVRLLWGGDETIARMRKVPTSSATHDLAFGDRFSFAAIHAEALLDTDEEARYGVAEHLYNDVYWYDQQGCASPRLLVWVGDAVAVEAARRLLFDDLARVIAAKNYTLDTGATLAKMTYVYGALIDRPVEQVHQAGNELHVLTLRDLDDFDRTHPGAGLFFESRVDALPDLLPFVTRKDQTLTVHGFSEEELTAFAASLRGRGIDRIVPFGDALSFGSVWDGYDLLAELTRAVDVVRPSR